MYGSPLRRLPSVGERVRILYLGAQGRGAVERVSDDLHELDVVSEEGRLVRFRLNQATARFVAVGPDTGARLIFEPS